MRVAKDHSSDAHLLRDLEATYMWLDAHQDEAADYIIQFHDLKLFLNVGDPKTEEWSWQCADELFFDVSRAEGSTVQLRTIGEFLRPYSDLLAIAGVEDIMYPTVPMTTGITPLHKLYSGFNKLRKKRRLTDVVFVCDGGKTRLLAHRFLLAATSSFLDDLFFEELKDEAAVAVEKSVEVAMDHSGVSVEAVLGVLSLDSHVGKQLTWLLDYLYTGKTSQDTAHRLGLSDALDALDLSNYWGLSEEFSNHMQASIIRGNLLTPATYEESVLCLCPHPLHAADE